MSVMVFPQAAHNRPLTERVAEEVRALMARRRVSQVQLAHELDLSQTAVSRRLRGLTPFDVNELDRVAELLGVHVSQLVGGSPPDSGQPGPARGPAPSPFGPLTPGYPDIRALTSTDVVIPFPRRERDSEAA